MAFSTSCFITMDTDTDTDMDADMNMETRWQRIAFKHLVNVKAEDCRFNSSQCNNLCYAFASKLSKHFYSPSKGKIYLRKTEGCQIMQRTAKEVYRVMEEAKVYLQNCSGDLWWTRCATLSTTGEAHTLHMHDLVWSGFCLDLNIVFVQTVLQDTYDALARRKLGDFHAEMSALTRIHDEYVDKKQLICTLQREYERTTANIIEKNRVEVGKFLATKLQAADLIEPALIGTVPAWLNVDPDHLEIPKHKSIGQGSYGAVYRGSWLGIDVAVKELPSGAYELFRTEALVLAKLHSPFIVQLIGTCVKEESCYVVMELVHSSLYNEIEKRSEQKICPPFPLHVAVDIMLQISRGMEYLHSQGIMHMDLKAANVLIEPSAVPGFRDEGYCRVKLCDFGMAGLKLYSFRCSFPKGTTYWRAPEAFAYPQEHIQMDKEVPKEYTYKADVYSFAMTCYEILTGRQPFEGVRNRDVYRTIIQGTRPDLPSAHIPLLLGDYIRTCWDTDPCRRPCFREVSMFLRYMKLLIMRADDLPSGSLSSIGSEFERQEIGKCFEGNSAFSDEILTNEEEALIVRALDGHFPLFSDPPPLPRQSPQILGSEQKGRLSRTPDYIKKHSCEELWDATHAFSRKISGASFVMWEGTLCDGSRVAVKENKTKNFLNEVLVTSQLHHPNILRLRGTDSRFYLVYDAVGMGSLGKRLFGAGENHFLPWNIRRRIGLGIARALSYLHEECESRILNVSLNSRDVLLDERFTPKLCGFGAAIPVHSAGNLHRMFGKKVEEEESRNVYEFGIVLLEMLSGSRWVHMMWPEVEDGDVAGAGSVMKLLDRRLKGEVEEWECRRVIQLALWCLARDPFERPSMNTVVSVMEGALELPMPPPASRIKWHSGVRNQA